MFCGHCGNKLPEDAKFCGKCGTPVRMISGGRQQGPPATASGETVFPASMETAVPASMENSVPALGETPAPASRDTAAPAANSWEILGISTQGEMFNPGNPGNPDNGFPRDSMNGGPSDAGAQSAPYGGPSNEGTQNSPFGGPSNAGAQSSPFGGPSNAGTQSAPFGDSYNAEPQNMETSPSTQAGNPSNATPAASPSSLPKHLAKVGSADTGSGGLRDIYIFDFLARLFTIKENIPLCIYLLMNVIFIGFICTMFTNGNLGIGMLIGLIVYAISVAMALSPIGEWLLRNRLGCVPITDPNIANRLEPIFNEVYAKAKRMNPGLPDDIKLFMSDDEAPNAFATGRRTVCITRGMLTRSDEQIKGTLGHEFGHLAHKDTDKILIISIGNTFVTGICFLAQIGAVIGEVFLHIAALFMGSDGAFLHVMAAISRFMTVTLVGLFFRVWTGIGNMLVMKTSRGNEYQADEYSCRLGYGAGLIATLQSFGDGPKPQGLFAALASSHPDTRDRITRIGHLMAGGQSR